MSSNPIASAIFGTDKALIIQGFVVSGIQKSCSSFYGAFPHFPGYCRIPALATLLRLGESNHSKQSALIALTLVNRQLSGRSGHRPNDALRPKKGFS
jgi:hypothetical protein